MRQMKNRMDCLTTGADSISRKPHGTAYQVMQLGPGAYMIILNVRLVTGEGTHIS